MTDEIVKYTTYIHGDKETAYEAARIAGITDEEMNGPLKELMYVGYEVAIDVTVNRTTGEIEEKLSS